jgi:hypothetical protein
MDGLGNFGDYDKNGFIKREDCSAGGLGNYLVQGIQKFIDGEAVL